MTTKALSAELRNVAQVIQCAAAWLRNQQPLSTMGEETADELESSVRRLVEVADALRDCARVEVTAELEQLVAEQFPGCHLEVSPPQLVGPLQSWDAAVVSRSTLGGLVRKDSCQGSTAAQAIEGLLGQLRARRAA